MSFITDRARQFRDQVASGADPFDAGAGTGFNVTGAPITSGSFTSPHDRDWETH